YGRAPRLPSGLIARKMFPGTPPMIGTAPPDDAVDFGVARSGSIFLAVKSLAFGGSATAAEESKRLQVSGLMGGFGGPGNTAQCAGRGPCNERGYVNSGSGGPGGQGGPAGSVLLLTSGTAISDSELAELHANADIVGGEAGPSE